MNYCGIDLHSNNSVVVITDETDHVLYSCRTEAGYRLLKTVDGIGEALATVILLEIGDITRFADVGNYASYCRCVGNKRESNG